MKTVTEPKLLNSLTEHENFLLQNFSVRNCIESIRKTGIRRYAMMGKFPEYTRFTNDNSIYNSSHKVMEGDVVAINLPLDILLQLVAMEYEVYKGLYKHTDINNNKFIEKLDQDRFEAKMRENYPAVENAYEEYRMLLALVGGGRKLID